MPEVDPVQAAYREVPYEGAAECDSHIRNLEALGRLFGVPTADITGCRVLEIGCAAGRNLLPQAVQFPSSRFVGLDVTASQIEEARRTAAAVGVHNAEFRHASITDVDASWGSFDYILVPGVFSWIAEDLQAAIFDVCRHRLAPHGVAFVSYNVFPGWHFQGVVRDALRYQAEAFESSEERIDQSRRMLEFLAEHTPDRSPHGQVFRHERDYLRTVRDDYLFHDYLVENNRPLYFHQFVDRAEKHGLQFVTEAESAKNSSTFQPAEAQRVLAAAPLVQRAQVLDFLRNESYRKSLLCHADVRLNRAPGIDEFERFHFALRERPQSPEFTVDDSSPAALRFSQGVLNTAAPLGKAALRHLIDVFPRAVTVDELLGTITRLLPTPQTADDRNLLVQSIAAAFAAGLLDLSLHPPIFNNEICERPTTCPLARHYAARRTHLVNARHQNVQLDEFDAALFCQLDGQHNIAEITSRLAESLPAQATEQTVFQSLNNLARRQLLVA